MTAMLITRSARFWSLYLLSQASREWTVVGEDTWLFCRRVKVRRKRRESGRRPQAQACARKYEERDIGRRPGSVVLLARLVTQPNAIRNPASSQTTEVRPKASVS
ncbi:hypothetical protein GE21DRAFT_1219065 [Neurospora crassa]|nr:hypothetical protein B9J10.30 [imported] - Neurospora crassa [Neurospora crassa]KHE80172.1 hypothetical protein GE21DRAFT_1219065 [Neurospora crassa]